METADNLCISPMLIKVDAFAKAIFYKKHSTPNHSEREWIIACRLEDSI